MRDLVENLKKLFFKYKMLVLYLFFGGLTTIINVVIYAICFQKLKIPNTPSVIIAWIVSVLFAYATNKKWVFESNKKGKDAFKNEFIPFITCRLATCGIDVLIMFIAVDIMAWPEIMMKLLSNIIVIILNYVGSKLWVFRKKDNSNK